MLSLLGRYRPQSWRTVIAWVFTAFAFLIVWFALVGPDNLARLGVGAFIRIPIEGLLILALLVALPPKPRRIVAWVVGVILGMLTVIKIIDMGFYDFLDRPFDSASDWSYFASAEGLLGVSIGHSEALFFLFAAAALAVAVVVFVPLSVVRLSRLASAHRTTTLRTVTALGAVWVLCAALGAHVFGATPIASSGVADLAYAQVSQVSAGLHDKKTLAAAAANDPYRTTPGSDLLTGLAGKDVIITFVESYGQVAVQGSSFSPQVDQVLRAGTNSLQAAGFSSESAWLTSPTFGGISWLAHSTLQSGLWINNQQRYNDLVGTDRTTLSDVFKRAGWHTVADDPSNDRAWPEGRTFYHYDQIYDSRDVGYQGPNFSYATMPDQFILSTFQRLELSKPDHAPVMAEIDLVSSHTPWTPLPHMVPWNAVGDGSIYNGMPRQGQSPTTVWKKASQVQAAYGQSIQYSLGSLISFVQTYPDPNLVLVVLGDHQPATIVSGQGASHTVPISIIAHDPAVMDRISSWGWQSGLLPSPSAPLWSMDAFRDRFLTAYGPQP